MNRAATVLCVLALLLISVLPIARTLAASVVVSDEPGAAWEFTTAHYERLFVPGEDAAGQDPGALVSPTERVLARWKLLGNSVLIALLSALGALLVGVPYALLTARTDVAGRRLLSAVYATPLLLPPLLVALAWTMAVPPSKPVGPDQGGFWDAPVAVLRAAAVFTLGYFPLVVLFARRALARVPASLEESARLAAGPWAALRRVTLPLAAPGVLAGALFVFLFALNDFAVVDFLNWVNPTPEQIAVYPFESFVRWNSVSKEGAGAATALGAPMALLGVALLLAIHRLVGRGTRATVTGAFRDPAPWRLGAWRVPAAVLAGAVVFLAAVIPVAGLAVQAGGLDSYRAIWRIVAPPHSSSDEVLWSLWTAAGATVVAVPLAFVLAHGAARRGRSWVLVLALLPLALPPIFLGAGYLRILSDPGFRLTVSGMVTERNPFTDPDGPRYGPILLLAAKYLPFALAALWAAFLEIDPRLEEAAAVAGVRPLDRVLGILAPLTKPAIALAAVLVLVFSLREIDTVVLLSSESVMRKVYSLIHYTRDAQAAALCVILIGMEAVLIALIALLVPRQRTAA
jgi:iron(III) transport system permease protein